MTHIENYLSILLLAICAALAACGPYLSGDTVYDRATCKPYVVVDDESAGAGWVYVEDQTGKLYKFVPHQAVISQSECWKH